MFEMPFPTWFFRLMSSLLNLLGSFYYEMFSYFVLPYVPVSAKYFLTDRKLKVNGKTAYYYAIGGYYILIFNEL